MHWTWLFAIALAAAQDGPHAPPERALSAFSDDRARRFDFWIGTWDVNLRMIQDDGSFEDSVRARANIYEILDGRAILELWDSEPIKGYSLRFYDADAGEWVLWLNWPSANRSRTSSLRGSFRHGRGDFFSERIRDDGSVLLSRYSFNDITPFSLRWDDHFSTDGGKTWRPHWIMEFTRVAVDSDWPIPRDRIPTFTDGSRCTLESFRDYEAIAGEWTGSVNVAGESVDARLSAYRVLDGCAVIAFVSAGPAERFAFLTFDSYREAWELDWLTSERGTELQRFFGSTSWLELTSESGDSYRWSLEGDTLVYRVDGDEESGTFHRR